MEDIIIALATAWGESGISIVRMSGKGCTAAADEIFKGRRLLAEYPARYMALGKLCAEPAGIFDEVLAVRFEEGSSYTGEESVEIYCHGGVMAAQRCIGELCLSGARIALPGEFTRRAFTNGRIDLAQAEAVLGIIKARSDEALYASARTLQGEFTKQIRTFLAEITELAAQLEVDLDFPEDGEGFLSRKETVMNMARIIKHGEELLTRCRSGLILREGIRVAIIGRPNVGKSSLLNALLREERAIVTPIPGTTRDRIEESIIHNGVPIRLVDTAGIRETDDEVESIGVDCSVRAISESDLRILVIDAAEGLTEEDTALWEKLSELPHIIAVNKSDIGRDRSAADIAFAFQGKEIISISALKGDGIDELKNAIIENISGGQSLDGGYGVTARQMDALTNSITSLKEARCAADSRIGDDVTISCVSEARAHIASLLGIDAAEDLLDVVFGNFCVGK